MDDLLFYVLIGAIVFVLFWETLWPRRPSKAGLAVRWLNNIGLIFIGQIILKSSQTIFILLAASIAQYNQFGLLTYINDYQILSLLLTIFIFEAVSYGSHVLMHRIPWLWRMHMVHHTDTEVDISTTYRHHPFEVLFSHGIIFLITILMAPSVFSVLVYQLILIPFTFYQHGNIYIPKKINQWLLYFVTTPDFHRLHHSSTQKYTDSNYGLIFPWFDYLFGTASKRLFDDHVDMELGLEYARNKVDSRLDQLLIMPFRGPSWYKQGERAPVKNMLAE